MGEYTGLGLGLANALASDRRQHNGLARVVREGEITHQVTVVAIDREPEILPLADRMDSEAAAQHVLFLLAWRGLFAQHPRRDLIKIARDMDALIDLPAHFLLGYTRQKPEATGDEHHVSSQAWRLADEFETTAIHQVTVGVQKTRQHDKTGGP